MRFQGKHALYCTLFAPREPQAYEKRKIQRHFHCQRNEAVEEEKEWQKQRTQYYLNRENKNRID